MTEIPLQQNTSQDVYDLGFDKSLNRGITSQESSTVYDTIQNALNTGSILSGGNLNLKTLTIGSLVKQVAPGDDIQAAIDAVSREGGGIVQLLAKTYILQENLNLKNNVALVGAGRDVTIIDFNQYSASVQSVGSGSTANQNIRVENLTIKNSTAVTAGLYMFFTDYFYMTNVKVTACGTGIYVLNCQNFYAINTDTSSNSGTGFLIATDGNRITQKFSLINCISDDNTLSSANGFGLSNVSNKIFFGSYVGCRAGGNGGRGFHVLASGSSAFDCSFLNCIAQNNVGDGFWAGSDSQRLNFMNCIADVNTNDGFEINGPDCLIFGCNSQDPIDINAATIIVGNHLNQSGAPQTDLSITEADTISYLNQGESNRTIRRVMQAKNTLATSLRRGDVVVLDATTDGESITTTTTGGNNKVYGVVDETITTGSFGRIHTEGYSTQVKVTNIAASLAVGDYLSTFTAAYYAQKAVAGDTVFAICLEAPSTGTAQVDALLITPRLI